MRNTLAKLGIGVTLLALALIAVLPVFAQSSAVINEFVFNHTGTDVNEYVEVFAGANEDLSALTLIEIEGDTTGSGVIDGVWALSTANGSGFWTTGLLDNEIENGTVTLLLVEGFSGAVGNDLDTNDDGTLDSEPWTAVVDSIAVTDGGSGDNTYGDTTLAPDFDGGGFTVGGASRIPDGADNWVRNDFDGAGLPAFPGATAAPGEAINTPGLTNAMVDEEPTTPTPTPEPTPEVPVVTIYEIQYTEDASGNSPYRNQTVTTQGVVTGIFGNGFFVQDGTGPWTGLWAYNASGDSFAVGDLVEITGPIIEYFGLTEMNGTAVVNLGASSVPAAEVLATGDVSQEQWESVFVRVENAVVSDDDIGFSEWMVDDGSGDVVVDNIGSYGYAPSTGDIVHFLQGPLNYSFSAFKIAPRDDGDIDAEEPPPTVATIMEIQGTEHFSPLVGEKVYTCGVVTLFTAFGGNFWIQDPAGDGDPATSDGIYVDAPVPVTPEVGDAICLVAKVEEQQFGAALPLTRLVGVSELEIVSSGNALLAPVVLYDLPDVSMVEGAAFWESLEGMLVAVYDGTVVAPTNGFGEFTLLAEGDAVPGSGYYPQTKQIIVRDLEGDAVDYNPERIMVDDSSLFDPIVVMPGDQVRSLVGVVDYTFGMYKLQPAVWDVKAHNLPSLPVSKRSGPDGVAIVTFNVENLFDTVDEPGKDDSSSNLSPEELDLKLNKLTLAVVGELELPEILVVQEIENTAVLQMLADRVNAAAGTSYMAVSYETSDGRGIEAGFMWDANRVSLLDSFQLSDAIVAGVSAAYGPTSASPGREPIVGVFDINGYTVTIVGNHFKSKGGDDALYGVNWPPFRVTEAQRKAQAQVVRDYVNMLFAADPNALVMVTGDLNDFPFEEPGEGTDPLSILEGGEGEVPLYNLVFDEKEAERFTYVFDGNSQVLDHMLVSPALYGLTVGVDILHFNAGYPAALQDVASTPLHVSDHDPIEGRFSFE